MTTISMDWYENREDPEHVMYELRCPDPAYEKLNVSIPASEVTERVARAKLIEKAFAQAAELGVDETRMRFHV